MKVFKTTTTNDLSEITSQAEFNKVKTGKWYHCQRVYLIKSGDGRWGLISMSFFERLGYNLCKIKPFKDIFFSKGTAIVRNKELKALEQKTTNCSTAVLNTQAVKPEPFSPTLKTLISHIYEDDMQSNQGPTEQALLFLSIKSQENTKGYEILFRKPDNSPLDSEFVSKEIAEKLEGEDLQNLDGDNFCYNLWTKKMDGTSYQFFFSKNRIGFVKDPSEFKYMTLNGDFGIRNMNSDEIVKNLNRT